MACYNFVKCAVLDSPIERLFKDLEILKKDSTKSSSTECFTINYFVNLNIRIANCTYEHAVCQLLVLGESGS